MEQWRDESVHDEGPGRRRAQVLAALHAASGPQPVEDVAAVVGLHPNTARFHLERLVQSGQAEREDEPRTSPGRPRALYRAKGDAASGQRSYRLLAEILASSLSAEGERASALATETGRRWGRGMVEDAPPARQPDPETATAVLVGVLDRVGFAPEAVTVGRRRRVLLHHCPFLEAARRDPDVVCAVHLGLMQGALEEMRAPVVADRLEPWATPDVCVAHLASRRRARERTAGG